MDELHRRARGRGPAPGSRFLPRAATMLGVAIACALLSNALAGPERHMRWVGVYDSAPGRGVPPAAGAQTPSPAAAPPAAGPAAAAGSAATRAFPPHPEKPWVEVSGDDVLSLHERGDVPFLDARRTSVYRAGHIAGSRPFSIWESDVDDKVKQFFNEGHDPSQPIVVYCSGGDCEDSHMLAVKLHMAGFDNALVYKDGFPDWQKRGLPVHTGDTP
jgi:rhodanese-related sulfurtransferase